MKLKDLINEQNFSYFEMKGRKFKYSKNSEIREIFSDVASCRMTLGFYELNREEEIKILDVK